MTKTLGNITKRKINFNREMPLEQKIMFLGVLIQIFFFAVNLFIGGYHCDELMTALNADSLTKYLTDIRGEKLPVYFDTWIHGGQSPTATYIVALSIKIFGSNIFAVRFPALISSIVALYFSNIFLKNTFTNKKYYLAILSLFAFSPFRLFSGVFMFDCNFFSTFLLIGLAFLSIAVNSDAKKDTKYYILSMIFFGMTFYCYMSSVMVTPLFLAVYFLVLIIKRKISIKNVIVSIITIFVVSLPFILFGLVVLNVIEPFTIFGFSFSQMPYYHRSDTLSINSSTSLSDGIINIIYNLLIGSSYVVFPAKTIFLSTGISTFMQSNFIFGFIMIIGFLSMLFRKVKSKKKSVHSPKIIATIVASFVTTVFYFAMVDINLEATYRITTIYFFIIIFEGIGFVEFYKLFKKISFKKILCVFLSISFVIFCFQFFYNYAYLMKTDYEKTSPPYADNLYKSLDYLNEIGCDNEYTYYTDSRLKTSLHDDGKAAVFLRWYYRNSDVQFKPFEGAALAIGYSPYTVENGADLSYQPTKDDTIIIQQISYDNSINCEYGIIHSYLLDDITYNSEIYEIKDFGCYSVIYKK